MAPSAKTAPTAVRRTLSRFVNLTFGRVIVFVLLTYLLSVLLVAAYFGLGGTWTMPGSLILSVVYMFMPLTAAILVQKVIYRLPLRQPLRIRFKPNRWFIVAWLLPPLIAITTRPVRP